MIKNKIKNSFLIIKSRGFICLFFAICNLSFSSFLKYVMGFELFKKKIFNFYLYLDLKDTGISRSLILFGEREIDQKFIIEKTLKKSMNVFDIGANLGYYVLLEKKKIKNEGKILAIEPSPHNIQILKKNLMLNKINKKEVQILQGAISNSDGKKQFFLSKQTNLNTFHDFGSAKKELTGKKINVNIFKISSIAKKYFKPDFIRMDVEGHEVEIIEGMLSSIKNGVLKPVICFEPHLSCYNSKHDFKNVLKELFNYGYKTKYLSSNSINGTNKIKSLSNSYKPFSVVKSDGEQRTVFKNIKNEDCINIVTQIGGSRTVLLSPVE